MTGDDGGISAIASSPNISPEKYARLTKLDRAIHERSGSSRRANLAASMAVFTFAFDVIVSTKLFLTRQKIASVSLPQ